jgi:CrcB protein
MAPDERGRSSVDHQADDERQDLTSLHPGHPDHDLLDDPVLPLLGLSILTIAVIAVGGALGTLARYVLEAHVPPGAGQFPWVTLAVNLSGSVAIGFLVPLTEASSDRAPLLRPFLMVGFLGGWTTYSTLAVETTLLVKHGAIGGCLAYVTATVLGGLVLVVVGHAVGRKMAAER